jgi:hypothetical protein
MNDQERQIDDSQTAFLQVEGELRLSSAPNPEAPPRCECNSKLQSAIRHTEISFWDFSVPGWPRLR